MAHIPRGPGESSCISLLDRRITMTLLCLVSLCNYLDRYMLGILIPNIKADLQLSDGELGFIGGTAFTIFYALMGIPIGRIADTKSRRLVLTCALSLWSAMTAVCGLSQSFVQLAVARIFVGVGEAGATPPSHSLIANIYAVRERGTALGLYTLGSPLGILLGFTLAGAISERLGWRWALILLGLPGLLLAIAIFLFLTEPRERGKYTTLPGTPIAGADLKRVMARLLRCATLRHASLGPAFYNFLWMALVAWLPSFFVRAHGLTIGALAPRLAVIIGISQLIGLSVGGALSDQLARRELGWYMRLPGFVTLASLPFYVSALLVSSSDLALLLLFIAFLLGSLQTAPAFAVVQGVAGPDARSVAVAVNVVCINVIGGLGAQLAGIVSDQLLPTFGSLALGYTLAVIAAVALLGSAMLFLLGSRTILRDWIIEGHSLGESSRGC